VPDLRIIIRSAVSASLLDHERAPKPAFDALRDACRPVIVVADRPPEHVHPGDHLSLDVHVVSDAHILFRDIVLSAHLSFGTESRHAWSWSGTLEPDTCVRVGRLEIDVPDPDHPVHRRHHSAGDPDSPIALVIDLHLVGGGLDVANRYGTWVVAGPHEH